MQLWLWLRILYPEAWLRMLACGQSRICFIPTTTTWSISSPACTSGESIHTRGAICQIHHWAMGSHGSKGGRGGRQRNREGVTEGPVSKDQFLLEIYQGDFQEGEGISWTQPPACPLLFSAGHYVQGSDNPPAWILAMLREHEAASLSLLDQ